jgi:hypothetical protein
MWVTEKLFQIMQRIRHDLHPYCRWAVHGTVNWQKVSKTVPWKAKKSANNEKMSLICCSNRITPSTLPIQLYQEAMALHVPSNFHGHVKNQSPKIIKVKV